ncbi:MAG: helix-turn-helix domain-containing protein [Clostridia bacterium]|nr:helix-turn-helix domain-containing protein [Clostridia bacterium]
METGSRIAELRKERGLTQQELAQKLFVSRELVCKWESGERKPDYRTVEKIAEALGVDPGRIESEDDAIMEELEGCVPAEGGPSDRAAAAAMLNNFLRTLPDGECDIFVRRYRFHETTAEIGARYGIGDNYVRSVLARTRRKLRKYFKRCKDE